MIVFVFGAFSARCQVAHGSALAAKLSFAHGGLMGGAGIRAEISPSQGIGVTSALGV